MVVLGSGIYHDTNGGYMPSALKSKGKQIERVLSKGQDAYLKNWVLAQFTRKSQTDQLSSLVEKEFAAVAARIKSEPDREKFRALCLIAEIEISSNMLRNSHDNGSETPKS